MFENQRGVWDAKDCALILIDYQPEMFAGVHSMDTRILDLNVCTLAKAARAFGIPVILSTVGVSMGVNRPTVESLRRMLPMVREIDRSSMNAWEDTDFLKAVVETERRRLVFGALYSEICLAYPVVDALRDEFEVSIVVDAVGGQSVVEHDVAIGRLIQAGAVPNTTCAMVAEWFRDWKSPLAAAGKEILVHYLNEKKAFNEGKAVFLHGESGVQYPTH